MTDRINSASDSSQRLLSRIANQIDVLSSSLNFSSPGDGQQPSSSRLQSGNVTVEEEVARVFNRSARPTRPVSTDRASPSANVQANPMYAMRRNFQQSQIRHPYQRTARANRKVTFANKAKATNSKGQFYTDVILLPSPDAEEVPRQGKKVWLSENGFVITGCRIEKGWSALEAENNLRSLFSEKIPLHVNLQILHSVHTKIIPPTLAPGQSLDGMIMYRLFKTKAIYLRSSEKLSDQSHQSGEVLSSEGSDIEDFPPLYVNDTRSGTSMIFEDRKTQVIPESSSQSAEAPNNLAHDSPNVIDLTEEYTALLNDSFPFEDDMEFAEEKEQSSKGSEEGKNTDDQPETIEEIICRLSSVIGYENISKFNVSRNHLWESAKRGFSKKSFSPKNKISVIFTDDAGISEGAIDMGGPTREFLTMLMNTISRSSLFVGSEENRLLSCFSKELQDGDYFLAGKIIAVSIVHGGPGPENFSPILFDSIVKGPEAVKVSVDDVFDHEAKQQLRRLQDCTSISSIGACLDEMEALIDFSGVNPMVRHPDDRFRIIEDVSKWLVVGKTRPALESFKNGLNTLGVLEAIRAHPTAFKAILCYNEKSFNANTFQSIFRICRSEQGTEKYVTESKVIMHFRDLLQDIEENDSDLSYPEMLAFTTGSLQIPPGGFISNPTIEFLHSNNNDERKFPIANTCSCILRLPTFHKEYSTFKESMEFAIKNCRGFGMP